MNKQPVIELPNPVDELKEQTTKILRAMAEDDRERHLMYGNDLNPFSLPGTRAVWQAGWDNDQTPLEYCQVNSGQWRFWMRGKLARELHDAAADSQH